MFQTIKADWLFVIPATLVWALALVFTAVDFLVLRGMSIGSGWTNLTGAALIVVGVTIRRLAKKDLGPFFSSGLKTSAEHKLVTTGIYRNIRHPAYLGNLLANWGIPLLFGSVYGFAIMLLLVPCFVYRMRIEEKMLVERFGEAYRDYVASTKKLIPCLY